jgi:hypothetical protein
MTLTMVRRGFFSRIPCICGSIASVLHTASRHVGSSNLEKEEAISAKRKDDRDLEKLARTTRCVRIILHRFVCSRV